MGFSVAFLCPSVCVPRSYGHFTSPTPYMSPRGILNETNPSLFGATSSRNSRSEPGATPPAGPLTAAARPAISGCASSLFLCLYLYVDFSFFNTSILLCVCSEVAAASVEQPPFVSPRGILSTNQSLSLSLSPLFSVVFLCP